MPRQRYEIFLYPLSNSGWPFDYKVKANVASGTKRRKPERSITEDTEKGKE
jgi:hypothetical protein